MQSGCVVPAHDAVTEPPSDATCASSPALASEASLGDVVLPWPDALASLGETVLPLEPAVPAADPPDPFVLPLEPLPVLGLPASVLPVLTAPLDAPVADPLPRI